MTGGCHTGNTNCDSEALGQNHMYVSRSTGLGEGGLCEWEVKDTLLQEEEKPDIMWDLLCSKLRIKQYATAFHDLAS